MPRGGIFLRMPPFLKTFLSGNAMKKLYHYLGTVEVFAAAFCFTLSCLLIFFAAIARTLDHPINWSQDLSLFLFAWSVFLSADAALRADRLVIIDLAVLKLPPASRKWITIANYLIILVFLLVLCYFGVKLSIFSRRRVFQGIPGFSYSWVLLAIPVGSLLQAITVVVKLKTLFTQPILGSGAASKSPSGS
ncbi:MAG: tripartite ATP-independent periplasmic transporter dctq component [Spirochaetes bacterium]|nr:MAG: tripartite ATP-independent periplasmic transporter dctq component [Spirochaetota bacterium]